VDLSERDCAKTPLAADELRELFAGHDPREFLNPKSPAFKATGLDAKELDAEQALKLMAQEPRLIKRPLTIAGKRIIAGFDKEALRKTFA
jgi:arsenate reductase-like glutaredoxin family protein